MSTGRPRREQQMRRAILVGLAFIGVGGVAATAARDAGPAAGTVTYSKQVARIMQARCESCHRADGAAPFALGDYGQARKWGPMIRQVVEQRRMPPWHADPRYGHFSNDRSLKPAEIATLTAWVDGGMPEGDRKDLPPPASFPKEWAIGKPDRVIRMPEEFLVPAEGTLPYQNFIVDPGFKEDVWVQRSEAKEGCRAVHHILVYIVRPDQPQLAVFGPRAGDTTVLCGTAPGDMPSILPPGMAKRIPAGAKLRFEVHYTPTGKPERDRSSLALVFAKQPPKREVITNALPKFDLNIPPGEANHREEASFTFPKPVRALSLMPHMHVRGKSWEYRLEYPDGRSEILLSVPKFDFNWQSVYRFADPPLIPKGARIHCIAHWDNSPANPTNPDPTRRVTFGPQTWDEMMMGWLDYVEEEAAG
jgi:mono/diheme cytochrome c family protein